MAKKVGGGVGRVSQWEPGRILRVSQTWLTLVRKCIIENLASFWPQVLLFYISTLATQIPFNIKHRSIKSVWELCLGFIPILTELSVHTLHRLSLVQLMREQSREETLFSPAVSRNTSPHFLRDSFCCKTMPFSPNSLCNVMPWCNPESIIARHVWSRAPIWSTFRFKVVVVRHLLWPWLSVQLQAPLIDQVSASSITRVSHQSHC